jgi:hypothetical protein
MEHPLYDSARLPGLNRLNRGCESRGLATHVSSSRGAVGQGFALGGRLAYRILCLWVSSTLSVDSGWPIREFSVYGLREKSMMWFMSDLNRAVVRCLRSLTPGMPAGSCEEHITSILAAGCLRGLRIRSAKSTLRGACGACGRRFGDESLLRGG